MTSRVLGACAAMLAAFSLGCTIKETPAGPDVEGIRVTGTGMVTAKPDLAIVQAGVQTFDADAQAAVQANNQAMDAAIAAVKGFGVADADIQTRGFSISPRRDFRQDGTGQIIGYDVSNSVSVKIRNLDQVGAILQGVVDAGANNVFGVTFTIDDPAPYQEQARTKAVEDARKKAESMAKTAGAKLGDVVRITESGGTGLPPSRSLDEGAFDKGVPVAVGDLTVTVSIEAVFELD